MKRVLVSGVLMLACGLLLAKLPAPDDGAKAKAAEAAAKTAWQGKVDAYQLCKAQDKVAAAYHKTSGKSPASSAESKLVPTAATQPATTGTPAAASAPPLPCADAGPFAYNPPEQKPLETSGAHSPAGTATSPPSVKSNSAEMAPKK